MSAKISRFVAILLLIYLPLTANSNSIAEFKELYTNKQYFELRDIVYKDEGENSAELLFFRGAVENKFNQSRESINSLEQFINHADKQTDAILLMDSYEMLADNYLKIFQYQKAAQTYSFILEKFKSRLDSAKIADYQNYTKFRALSEVPPQTTSIKEKSIIERQGGRVPIHFGQQVFPLGFDTGANFSIITASLADKFGFKIIDETIEVSSITGDKIDASFGVSPEMTIGKATISNAIFLVFEDKHLYITEADHQINGVIGFPVISALKEITFLKSGEIIVPAKPGSAHNQNMCLDELTPLIAGKYKGNRLIFSFDTGANKSDLYPPFFEAYKDEIADNFSSFTKTLRGVGSRREVKAYRMEDFEIEFSGKKAYFSEIPVLTEPTIESSRYLYGNLGRDLVNQFEKMNLNFVSMSLVFE